MILDVAMTKPIINITLSYLIGGAYVGLQRVAEALPEYKWTFTKTPDSNADICLYMNDHNHYLAAKELGIKHIVQRKTGVRSLKIPEPDDLDSLICGSKASFNNSKHSRKVLIYNGLDFNHLKTIRPKPNIDLLVAESRCGKGQRIDASIQYAIKHKKHLTILGDGKGLAENTYKELRKKYPQFTWIGRVSPDEALSYIKGCNKILIANPSHGVANQALEAIAMGKKIIDLTPGKVLEIPDKKDIDIRNTANQYDALFKSILNY